MARQGTSLMDIFENDNEAFLKFFDYIRFVQNQIDYDYFIN